MARKNDNGCFIRLYGVILIFPLIKILFACPTNLDLVGLYFSLHNFYKKYKYLWLLEKFLVEGYERGNHHPPLQLRRERKCMIEPDRTEWQIRCALMLFVNVY
jgi:hypothetical protein